MSATKKLAVLSTALALIAASSSGALAQKKYDTGATDTEIKIGNIMPYSGPASAYGVIGKTEEAYFKKVNAEGGINGRKINFISYDDAYSPPRRSSRHASWSKALKSCSSSIRWVPRRIRRSRSTSTPRRCRNYSS